jgi:hypothetical protein
MAVRFTRKERNVVLHTGGTVHARTHLQVEGDSLVFYGDSRLKVTDRGWLPRSNNRWPITRTMAHTGRTVTDGSIFICLHYWSCHRTCICGLRCPYAQLHEFSWPLQTHSTCGLQLQSMIDFDCLQLLCCFPHSRVAPGILLAIACMSWSDVQKPIGLILYKRWLSLDWL